MEIRPFLPDPAGLGCEHLEIGQDRVTLNLDSLATSPVCPVCRSPSARVHSRYTRTVSDLPWLGKTTRLRIRARRFFCDNPGCPRATFSEPLPQVAAAYGRKTFRLAQTLCHIGFSLGGEAGARLAGHLRMPASGDTLLRLIRRTPLAPVPMVSVLGVDDWAWRKGQRYGTVLCDLERHRLVDLLAERSAVDLANWLTAHPGAEVISRDRGGIYAEGARAGAPQAVQVADRFHLLCNVREALVRVLDRHHLQIKEAARAATAARPRPPPPPVMELPVLPAPVTSPACQQPPSDTSRSRRLQRYTEVAELHRQGLTMRQIAKKTDLHRSTVRKFLQAGEFPERAARKSARQIDRFAGYLRQRWDQGCHNAKQLAREVAQQGFKGSCYAVRRYVAAWRNSGQVASPTEPARGHSAIERPSSNRVAWLLMGYPADPSAEEEAFASSLRKNCPKINAAVDMAQEFGQMVHDRRSDLLDAWIAKAQDAAVPHEVRNFASGLKRDYEAVKAALSVPWSNGQVEGQINRLKFIKRQMYGRAHFDLLRLRVLNTG
jgi:transposase